MILKSVKVLPILVLLCVTIFAVTMFSVNHATNTVWKESETGFDHNEHSSSVFVGDPVEGGGLPDGVNQPLNDSG
jgi:hypothetical protein